MDPPTFAALQAGFHGDSSFGPSLSPALGGREIAGTSPQIQQRKRETKDGQHGDGSSGLSTRPRLL